MLYQVIIKLVEDTNGMYNFFIIKIYIYIYIYIYISLPPKYSLPEKINKLNTYIQSIDTGHTSKVRKGVLRLTITGYTLFSDRSIDQAVGARDGRA